MSKRVVLSLAAVFLWLAGCGDNKKAAPDASGPTGLILSIADTTMAIGDTVHVTGRYQNGDDASTIHWSSSDASAVSVTPATGGAVTLTALAAGTASITATGTGNVSASIAVMVSPATLLSISTPPLPRLAAGTTLPIPITAHYSDGSMADVTSQSTFTVDDTTIATIDAAGTASGLKKGDTQIHATYSGLEISTLLTVSDALLVSIAITPANPNVPLGVSPHLTATGTFSDTTTQDLTTQVAWTSSMTGIATIGMATGIVTTVAVGGPTVITATKGAVSTTTNLTVIDVSITSIAVTPATPTVAKGVSQQFVATATFNDNSTADVTTQATWASDTSAVATMDIVLGNALTHATGTATISAAFMGKSGSTLLTVGAAVLATIVVTPANPTVAKGLTQQFTATGTNTDATAGDLTGLVWASATPAHATITAGGNATAVDLGTSLVSATVGTVSGSTTITVGPAAITAITITVPDNEDIPVGADFQYLANGLLTDGTTVDVTAQVTWTSSDATNLPVGSNDGLASALGTIAMATPATITASHTGATSATQHAFTHVAPIGGSFAASTGAGKIVCDDGVRFSELGTFAYACYTGSAFQRATIAGTALTWVAPTTPAGATNGLALVVHQSTDNQVQLLTAPGGTQNQWTSLDNGDNFTGGALLVDSASATRFLYAGTQRMMAGNVFASWDSAGAGQAVALVGGPLTTARNLGTATGIGHGVAVTSNMNSWVVAFGQTPTGAAATGGVFHSTNNVASFTDATGNLPAGDKDLVYTIVAGADAMTAIIGVQGGGRIYKTVDGGATWTASATGIPRYAKVNALDLAASDATGNTILASTTHGLFVSTDGGATWASTAFLGRDVRGAAINNAGTIKLVGVRDNIGDGVAGVYSSP